MLDFQIYGRIYVAPVYKITLEKYSLNMENIESLEHFDSL
jgi:hypothetical protein